MARMYKKVALLTVMIGIFFVSKRNLWAFDIATHMYIGSQTFDLWQNFDNTFYNYLIQSSDEGIMTRKFYYIGLTLPDLMEEEGLAWSKAIIDTLYNHPPEVEVTRALNIYSSTYNQVQTDFIFYDPKPNQNLQKLWEMANYTKNQNWDSFEKAIVYGALMHVIQDVYGHMVLQPSLWGYGRTIDPDSALSEFLLRFGETFHEVFYTATYIPNWTFIKELYQGLFINGFSENVGFMEFLSLYDQSGRYVSGWQDANVTPVQKFVDAANAVNYNIGNLSYGRVKAYLHGWGIINFLLYGYRWDFSDLGGLFSHPWWNANDIANFWADIGDEDIHLGQLEGFLGWLQHIPFLDIVFREIGERVIHQKIYEALKRYIACGSSRSWSTFTEQTAYWDEAWACVPENERPEFY